jgi:L-threonylcarbamoyladenylate synthase
VIKEGVDYIVTFRQKEHSEARPSGIVKLGKNGTINIIRK